MTLAGLPLLVGALAIWLVALVAFLGVYFLVSPARAMAFSTHRPEDLPLIMAGRYFTIAALMAGALYDGRPQVIGFVFTVTALNALFDALVYLREGKPFVKHLISASLSAVVAIMAMFILINTGAA